MGALFLDVRNRLIGESEVYRGTLSRAAVEPRAIFKEALLLSASGFLLFHTHPSGDPSPSPEDLSFTRRIAEGGEMLGVRLLDHIILGSAGPALFFVGQGTTRPFDDPQTGRVWSHLAPLGDLGPKTLPEHQLVVPGAFLSPQLVVPGAFSSRV